jgi:choline-glycine betaine transporter
LPHPFHIFFLAAAVLAAGTEGSTFCAVTALGTGIAAAADLNGVQGAVVPLIGVMNARGDITLNTVVNFIHSEFSSFD